MKILRHGHLLDAKYKVLGRNNPVVLHGDGHLHVHVRTVIRLSASSCRLENPV